MRGAHIITQIPIGICPQYMTLRLRLREEPLYLLTRTPVLLLKYWSTYTKVLQYFSRSTNLVQLREYFESI